MFIRGPKDWQFLEVNLHWFVIGSVLLCFLKVHLNNPSDITASFVLGLLIICGLIYGGFKIYRKTWRSTVMSSNQKKHRVVIFDYLNVIAHALPFYSE